MLPLGTITEAHFDRIFGTNVREMLFTVQVKPQYVILRVHGHRFKGSSYSC